MNQKLTVHLPKVIVKDMQRVADERGESRAAVMRKAIPLGLVELDGSEKDKEDE